MLSKIMAKIRRGSSSTPKQLKSFSINELPNILNHQNEVAGSNSYFDNVVVHRCVNLIADSAAHVPWQVYLNIDGKRQLCPKHPVNRILSRPNFERAGADFFTEVIASLLLYGNSYCLAKNIPSQGNKRPELYHLHSDNVQLLEHNNRLIGYRLNLHGSQQEYRLDPVFRTSRILHFKSYNPSSKYSGSSSLKAASKAINLYNRTLNWNKSLLQNAAKPSGALAFEGGSGMLTDEQFNRLKEQFYENYTGATNSGRPLILEGGLSWQDTSNAQQFEKFLELKDSSARDIAISFNVPPQLLGINGDNTYSNMQEARLALWEENIIPLLSKLSHTLTNWFSHWYDDNLEIEFDRDSISALSTRRENIWSKLASASFMTINEKRAAVGLPPIAGGDELA